MGQAIFYGQGQSTLSLYWSRESSSLRQQTSLLCITLPKLAPESTGDVIEGCPGELGLKS